MTHFLQQGHTYSNKATPPNSASPYGPNTQTYESMGPFLFKSPQPIRQDAKVFGEYIQATSHAWEEYGSKLRWQLPPGTREGLGLVTANEHTGIH